MDTRFLLLFQFSDSQIKRPCRALAMLSLAHTCFRLTSNYQHRRIRFASSLKLPWKVRLPKEWFEEVGNPWQGVLFWRKTARVCILKVFGVPEGKYQEMRDDFEAAAGEMLVARYWYLRSFKQFVSHLVRSAYLQEHWQDVSGQLGVSHISHVVFLGTRHLRGRDFANSVFIRAEDAVGQCKTGKE